MAAKKGRPLRTLAYTKTFKKDYQRMAAAGRYDMTLLNEVGGLLIAMGGALWLYMMLKLADSFRLKS